MSIPLKPTTPSKDSGNLDREDWIAASLLVLARNGIEAIRIERLAKDLKVTKGSFYWHFKDRPALLDAMLASWRKRATVDIIDRIERGSKNPSDRLRKLVALPHSSFRSRRGADVEAGIRLWARSEAKVSSAVKEIDRLRLDYIQSLILSSGAPSGEVTARATLFYALMLAEATLGTAINRDVYQQCEALLLSEI